jgi:hypothetical protein
MSPAIRDAAIGPPVCGKAPGVLRRCATTAPIKERDSSLETHLSGDY